MGGGRAPRDQPVIVQEDADFIVIDKPPGLLSADVSGGGEPNAFDWLKDRYRRQRNRGGRVFIIHRLDKDASGLMVFGLSPKGFAWLKDDFRAKRVHRLYLGLAEGNMDGAGAAAASEVSVGPGDVRSVTGGAVAAKQRTSAVARTRQLPMGTIQTFLQEGPDGAMRVVPVGEAAAAKRRWSPDLEEDDARLAVTHYRVLDSGNNLSLVQFRLETGRRNQIRVHMQHLGHPLVGDRIYGATKDPVGRLGLHAVELGFRHPSTGESVRFRSDPPASFYTAIGKKPSKREATEPIAEAAPSGVALLPPAPTLTPEASVPPKPAASVPKESAAATPRAALALESSASTSWDHVASWYDRLIGEKLTDHYERVILPGTLRLLDAAPGSRVLDVACGQGVLCRVLASRGVSCVGVDASARLIEAARRMERGQHSQAGIHEGESPHYLVGDARSLDALDWGDTRPFDGAACVMAIMNIDPVEPVFSGIARRLRPGGALAIVMLHPAFRAPGQTGWGWAPRDGDASEGSGSAGARERDDRGGKADRRGREERPRGGRRDPSRRSPRPSSGAPELRQFRRIDGYLSNAAVPILMNPGRAASGGKPVETWTFHRPLQAYSKALRESGFVIEDIQEWPSARESEPGPRAAEENRARREIPMFLGLRAVRR